jgi:hypothetical protein
MISALQALFAPQVRKESYEYINEFLTTRIEENTCLESHLTNMHRLYRCLTNELNYLMTDELGIDVVLPSLPPSYNTYVEGYLMIGFDIISPFISASCNSRL